MIAPIAIIQNLKEVSVGKLLLCNINIIFVMRKK